VIKRIVLKSILISTVAWGISCGDGNRVDPSLTSEMPQKMIWAWERPEDLRFADPNEFGIAFLAQTIFLRGNDVVLKQRRQPLEVAEGAYVIAVTRIETAKGTAERPSFDEKMVGEVGSLIRRTVELPYVRGVQVDFDAVVSEREFYSSLIKKLRRDLDPEIKLTMTALASWCAGDSWFNDFPVSEAVPMVFHMGADTEKIRAYLKNGNDWDEPLCRGSYGLLIGDEITVPIKSGRRLYYFKDSSWTAADIERLK
jgi:hypothetical protein